MSERLRVMLHHLVSKGYTIGYCQPEPLSMRIVIKKRFKAWVLDGITERVLLRYLSQF